MRSLRGEAILLAGGVAAAAAGTVMLAPGGGDARPVAERAAVTGVRPVHKTAEHGTPANPARISRAAASGSVAQDDLALTDAFSAASSEASPS